MFLLQCIEQAVTLTTEWISTNWTLFYDENTDEECVHYQHSWNHSLISLESLPTSAPNFGFLSVINQNCLVINSYYFLRCKRDCISLDDDDERERERYHSIREKGQREKENLYANSVLCTEPNLDLDPRILTSWSEPESRVSTNRLSHTDAQLSLISTSTFLNVLTNSPPTLKDPAKFACSFLTICQLPLCDPATGNHYHPRNPFCSVLPLNHCFCPSFIS